MNRSIVFAVLFAVLAAAWVLSGQLDSGKAEPRAKKPPAELTVSQRQAKVRVRQQAAEPHVSKIVLRGSTEAVRSVAVRTEIKGRIVELPVAKGDRVEEGTVIARLAEEDRPARVKEAKALLQQRRIEYKASSKLTEKGYRAETQLAAAAAGLKAAQAMVERAEIELANTVITAPFAGILDDRSVEMGDFVEQGDVIARVVDMDPILVVAQVSERHVGLLGQGDQGSARLAIGQEIDGRLRFVSSVADADTRTYRAELEVRNADGSIPHGMTAELRLPVAEVDAYYVSPAILTLTDTGEVGVKAVDSEQRVRFHPAKIIDTDAKGVWLAGLPKSLLLITVGQEFVTEGQEVIPIDEATLEPLVPLGETS